MSSIGQADTMSRREARDELLITALATGMTYEKAGQAADCSSRTVARRMDDPEFARRVSKRRGERVVAAAGQLTSLSDSAIEAIRGCLGDEDPRVRLAAAKTLLDLAVKFRNSHDLEVEIDEIRQHLGMGE